MPSLFFALQPHGVTLTPKHWFCLGFSLVSPSKPFLSGQLSASVSRLGTLVPASHSVKSSLPDLHVCTCPSLLNGRGRYGSLPIIHGVQTALNSSNFIWPDLHIFLPWAHGLDPLHHKKRLLDERLQLPSQGPGALLFHPHFLAPSPEAFPGCPGMVLPQLEVLPRGVCALSPDALHLSQGYIFVLKSKAVFKKHFHKIVLCHYVVYSCVCTFLHVNLQMTFFSKKIHSQEPNKFYVCLYLSLASSSNLTQSRQALSALQLCPVPG